MSVESVCDWLAANAPELRLIEGTASTATVADAATALGVEAARIAKTLALRVGDTVLLVVARGDARLDNQKCKAEFGGRPRMLDGAEAEALTGHPVGGLCPFGLARRCQSFATSRSASSARCFPRQDHAPHPSRLRRSGWRNWCRSAGWMCAGCPNEAGLHGSPLVLPLRRGNAKGRCP